MEYSDNKTTLGDLKEIMKNFVAEREWNKYHDPKNLSMSIAIEAAELMEIFQWQKNEEAIQKTRSDEKTFTHVCEEISDIMLYCMSLSNILNIDLSKAIVDKVSKNVKKYPREKCRGNYEKPEKH